VVFCDVVAFVNDRNDDDAVGYSLHTSLCGWPGVITKWKLSRQARLFPTVACMHDRFFRECDSDKNASGLVLLKACLLDMKDFWIMV
jgi:hypothetical protein